MPIVHSPFARPLVRGLLGALLLAPIAHTQTGISKLTVLGNFTKYNDRNYAGLWGYVAPDKREYALVTVMNTGGTSIVDITDPKNPVERGYVASPSGFNHEVKAYGDLMYKCADQGTVGMQIVDLSGLPAGVKELPGYKGGDVVRCHTLWIDSTRSPALLYLQQGGNTGVVILSLADPRKPVELSRVPVPCHDMYAKGNRLYISGGDAWSIWDVTDGAAPQRRAHVKLSTVASGLGEQVGISHNVWPSDDGRYAFTTQETIGTTVKSWDLSDEAFPKLLDTYVHDPKIIAHNVRILGHLMYVSHYLSGVRVVDVRDPREMKEVAYHKPNGGTTSMGMGGSWDVYCGFPSGRIIHADGCMGSTSASGLWILQPDASLGGGGGTSLAPAGRPMAAADAFLQAGMLRFRLSRPGSFRLSLVDYAGRELFAARSRGPQGWNALAPGDGLPRGAFRIRLTQTGLP